MEFTKQQIHDFRKHLNDTDVRRDHRHYQYHQRTRKYGDYLWFQDREGFYIFLGEWLKDLKAGKGQA